MSAKTKKILNRGGLGLMIVGVIMIVVGGGDTKSAIDTVGKVVLIGGDVMIFVRELMN